jgi:hypothetical protein
VSGASRHSLSPRKPIAVRPRFDFTPDPLVIGELVHQPRLALWPLGEKPWTYATGSPTIGSRSVTLLRSASHRLGRGY